MAYMKPLVHEDLVAINDLSELTWSWDLHYWTERGADHGAFWVSFYHPVTLMHCRVDCTSVSEAIYKAIDDIKNKRKLI